MKHKAKTVKKPTKAKKPKMYYQIIITYPAERFAWTSDWPIIKAIGEKYESGSGLGMGGRDINFVFKKKIDWTKAKKRLATLKKKFRWIKSTVGEQYDE